MPGSDHPLQLPTNRTAHHTVFATLAVKYTVLTVNITSLKLLPYTYMITLLMP